MIADAAKQAKTIFFVILSACLYCLLTAAKTTHLALMDNSLLVEMPIIKKKASLTPLYPVAPIVLLISFPWMNSYMRRV